MAEEPLKYLSVHREKVSDALAQSEWAQKKLVWVPHPEAGFLSGSIKTEKGDELTVELQDGSKRTVHKDEVQKMNPPKFEKVEDMAELSFLNEASVLYNLQARYFSGLIYVSNAANCAVWRVRGQPNTYPSYFARTWGGLLPPAPVKTGAAVYVSKFLGN